METQTLSDQLLPVFFASSCALCLTLPADPRMGFSQADATIARNLPGHLLPHHGFLLGHCHGKSALHTSQFACLARLTAPCAPACKREA